MSEAELARYESDAIAALISTGFDGMEPSDGSALGQALRRTVEVDFTEQLGSHASTL
jgi:hypothetical protein